MKSNNFFKNNFIYIFFFIYFLIGIYIIGDYGISIDEEFQRYSGFYWLNYILEFTQLEVLKTEVLFRLNDISGHTLPNPENFPFYGVTFDLPMAFLETILDIKDSRNFFLLRHYATFLIFFTSSIFFYLILKNRFYNNKIIILGLLLYITSPRIFGDSFYNNKDIVFLSLVTINVYFFFKIVDTLNFKNLAYLSIFSAIACSTRIVGIFIPLSFLFFLFLSKVNSKKSLLEILKITIFFSFLFFFFFFFFWPYLWSDPFLNLIYSFKIFSEYPANFKMLFNGQYIDSRFLPLSYVPVWIAITTPFITLLLSIFGYLLLSKRVFVRTVNIREQKIHNDFWRGDNEKKDFFIFFNFTLIFFYIILANSDLYNGWRHLYFLHIFMIYFACVAIYRFQIKIISKKFYFLILFVLVISNFYKIYKYHPFQGSYFNNYVINKKNFEADYWGLAGVQFISDIIGRNPNISKINIGVASYIPLERSLRMLKRNIAEKINIIGQDYENSDYIFNNNTSEVDKKKNNKYNIPKNFKLISEFYIEDLIIYQIYKKN